jgi:hypothetical protein
MFAGSFHHYVKPKQFWAAAAASAESLCIGWCWKFFKKNWREIQTPFKIVMVCVTLIESLKQTN